ncbi:MAG: acetylornithine carbamoyltransferase [Cyclobacteriaceae bacterium]
MNQFTSADDIADPGEDFCKKLKELIDLSLAYRKNPLADRKAGDGKTLGLVFFNPSLRTRISTMKAAYNLGINVISMNADKDGWSLETEDGVIMNQGNAEHIKEAAAVMGSYCDMIGVRSFPGLENREADYSEKLLKGFINHAGVPVINLESATLHPLQSLADLVTMESIYPGKKLNVVMTWAPHVKALPQSVANSFAQWIGRTDHHLTVAQPVGFELSEQYTKEATITYDQEAAFRNADLVYVKNWSSYDDYGNAGDFPGWRVDMDKLKLTNKASLFHCLPVRRNVVITDAALDSSHSKVIDQAANREFATQSVLKKLLENL